MNLGEVLSRANHLPIKEKSESGVKGAAGTALSESFLRVSEAAKQFSNSCLPGIDPPKFPWSKIPEGITGSFRGKLEKVAKYNLPKKGSSSNLGDFKHVKELSAAYLSNLREEIKVKLRSGYSYASSTIAYYEFIVEVIDYYYKKPVQPKFDWLSFGITMSPNWVKKAIKEAEKGYLPICDELQYFTSPSADYSHDLMENFSTKELERIKDQALVIVNESGFTSWFRDYCGYLLKIISWHLDK